LALVAVETPPLGFGPLEVAKMDSVAIGSDVHAIGHPTGESWTYTKGVVSQIRRDYSWKAEDGVEHKADLIQTQTPINPGNSGGPLLNDLGQIVGVNSFKSTDSEGLNFAVAASEVQRFLATDKNRFASKPRKEATACEVKVISESRTVKPPGIDRFF